MITRAHIRRQLRASGGITSLTPREGYFLGSIVRGAKKAVGKVADVAKQIVKSPIGKEAILGLGASYLGPKIMGSQGLSSFLGKGSFSPFKALIGAGTADSGMGPSGLGKLLGSKFIDQSTGGMTGLGKMLGAGGLIGYFTSKGASEEEAKELARDVYIGEGIGFDQIRADLNKYKSGELSQSQMFDKNYRFLTPRDFVGAEGGRVGLAMGGDPLPEDPTKPINPFGPKPTGPVLPNKMAEIPKGLSMEDAVRSFDLAKPELSKKLKGTKKYLPAVLKFFKNRKLSAQGGRIGYDEGSNSIDFKVEKELKDKAPGSYKLFGGGALSPLQHMLRYLTKKRMEKEEKNKNKKADGGIMDMPTGNMRRNQAGVMERDYRDEGGFVPVGVKEKADDVPAMLSKNEFVMTADAVRGAGDGNIKKGAQRMYDLMKRNEGKVA